MTVPLFTNTTGESTCNAPVPDVFSISPLFTTRADPDDRPHEALPFTVIVPEFVSCAASPHVCVPGDQEIDPLFTIGRCNDTVFPGVDTLNDPPDAIVVVPVPDIDPIPHEHPDHDIDPFTSTLPAPFKNPASDNDPDVGTVRSVLSDNVPVTDRLLFAGSVQPPVIAEVTVPAIVTDGEFNTADAVSV